MEWQALAKLFGDIGPHFVRIVMSCLLTLIFIALFPAWLESKTWWIPIGITWCTSFLATFPMDWAWRWARLRIASIKARREMDLRIAAATRGERSVLAHFRAARTVYFRADDPSVISLVHEGILEPTGESRFHGGFNAFETHAYTMPNGWRRALERRR